MNGVDFADAERGYSGTARASGEALLFDHEDVLAASRDAEVELGEADAPAPARVSVDGVSLQLDLAPVGHAITLGSELLGPEEISVCRVLGELRRGDEAEQVACLGIRSSGNSEPDFSQVSLTRSVAIAFADGAMLGLRAARPRGAEAHGDEETVAAVVYPEGEAVAAEQALISTHYDEDGRHVRATMELWPGGEEPGPPIRAAGSIVCGTTLPVGDRRLEVAFFRWSMGGKPGLGRYEVLAQRVD